MKMTKRKILFVLKLPPPVHGSTLMNQKVHDSQYLRESFTCRYVRVSLSKNLDEIGHKYFFKIIKLVSIWVATLRELLFFRPHLVYFAISPVGAAFLKDFLLVSLIKLTRTPVVFHIHGKGMGIASQKNRVWKYIYNRTFKGEFVICLSGYLTGDIESFYPGKPFILPNGIGESYMGITTPGTGNGEIPAVLYLSNLMRTKGLLDLIDALTILHKKGIKFTANIVGGPVDISHEFLNDYIAQKAITKSVNVLGPLYGPEKQRILANSDVLVFPTYYSKECFPIVILEAMQAGLPVLSTLEAAIPDMVENGVTGFLVRQNDAGELAGRLETMLIDRDLRKSMGAAGRKRYRELFTLEKFETGLSNIIKTITGSP